MPKINKISSILAEMFFFIVIFKDHFHLFLPVVSYRVYILPPKE